MAETMTYALDFGSIPKAPSREAVKLQMEAEALQRRAHRELLLRERDPWPGGKQSPGDKDEPEEYDYWDEMT